MKNQQLLHRITDLDVKRVHSLTDGVFAIVITLLALDLKVPAGMSHEQVLGFLSDEISPRLIVFVTSFIVVAAFWVDSHFHHHLTVKTDQINIWLNILFLLSICLIPFSSGYLANYRQDVLSIIIYSANLALAGIFHLFMFMYSWRKNYVLPHISPKLFRNLKLRILVPVVVYILIIPLCFLIREWVFFLFFVPLIFQILFGRSRKETNEE